MIITIDVQPIPYEPTIKTALPMTITFDYSDQQSISKALRDFAGISSGVSGAPSSCDPNLNACGDECGTTSEFFKSGFFTHEQLIAARLSHGSYKVVKKCSLTREAEAT